MEVRQSPRDQRFIRNLARNGKTINQIYVIGFERFGWDGPIPTLEEIATIIEPVVCLQKTLTPSSQTSESNPVAYMSDLRLPCQTEQASLTKAVIET